MNDLTPNDLSHLSEAEFQALCPQGEHAPGPEPLSPAARAVRDAALATYDESIPKDDNLWALDRASVVAALRAAADQVVPEEKGPPRRGMRPGGTGAISPDEGAEDQRAATRRWLRRIASELEDGQ